MRGASAAISFLPSSCAVLNAAGALGSSVVWTSDSYVSFASTSLPVAAWHSAMWSWCVAAG